jgi:adenine-specific DNA-methyltransferase
MEEHNYLTSQIMTYMGNKRKFLPTINNIINNIGKELGRKISIAEGFSGTGIVSRLFKTKAHTIYVNDIAGYSETLNKCYLANISDIEKNRIRIIINQMNVLVDKEKPIGYTPWISKHWSPDNDKNIKKDERVYFTEKNGKRIDKYRHLINQLSPTLQPFLLAPLLIKCSMHNNTNGQFSAFYKDENKKIGKYGGKNGVDVKRITKPISLEMPVLLNTDCKVYVNREDTNTWVKKLPKVDLVYYDPPYNKHPYHIYYFLLDIINNWNIKEEIPNTNRGQPKNWVKSKYNSFTNAEQEFEELIKNTKSNFIMISYNNGGIIPLNKLDAMLNKYGDLIKIPIEHKIYNRLRGIANYKRDGIDEGVKEFIWLLDCRKKY